MSMGIEVNMDMDITMYVYAGGIKVDMGVEVGMEGGMGM